MRIIQSAWTCNQSNLLTSNSGWLSPKYNLMSWALSCLQLKQYYPEFYRRMKLGECLKSSMFFFKISS